MTKILDIYIRAHAGTPRKEKELNYISKKISFFTYHSDGRLVLKESADSLIFGRICKNLSPAKRKEVENLTQSQDAVEHWNEFWTDVWEYFSSPRKGKCLSFIKKEEEEKFPNYIIDWEDGSIITAIIACGSDSQFYCWIPEQRTEPELSFELRNLLDVASFPKSVRQLVGVILDKTHFLGKVAINYDHVNVHWSSCRPQKGSKNSIYGYSGFHDSRRLNALLIHEWRKQSPVILRRNSI